RICVLVLSTYNLRSANPKSICASKGRSSALFVADRFTVGALHLDDGMSYLEVSMSFKFKPLFHQVLVIQGATSEAGIATVRSAAEQGAKIYMIDTNEDLLQILQNEMRNKGYDTAYAVANPGEADQVRFAADQCLATFS